MIIRPQVNRRNRRKLGLASRPVSDATATAAINAAKARLTFDQPVTVNGLPTTITRQAAGAGPQLAPTAVTVVSPTVVDLTYAAAVVATDVLTIPANVSEIRTATGGHAAPLVKTF